jgi:hypothetical protein
MRSVYPAVAVRVYAAATALGRDARSLSKRERLGARVLGGGFSALGFEAWEGLGGGVSAR